METNQVLLIYVDWTYMDLNPYMKGIHLTIDGWLQVREEDIWYLRGKGYSVMKEEEKVPLEEGFSKVRYIVKAVNRLQKDLEYMLTLTETYLLTKTHLR